MEKLKKVEKMENITQIAFSFIDLYLSQIYERDHPEPETWYDGTP